MDVKSKRLLLLCLILGLGSLVIVSCGVTPSTAAVVRGQIMPIVTPLPEVTRVAIRGAQDGTVSAAVIIPSTSTPTVSAEVSIRTAPTQAIPTVGAAVGPYPGWGTVYIVQTGDNLYRIAKRFGLTVEQIAAANGIVYPYYIQIGQSLIIPSGGAPPGGTHLVRTGDNLYRISKLYGVTVEQIAAANNIPPPYIIKVGQILVIPGYAGPTPTSWPTTTPWWTPTATPWWTPTPTPTAGPGMQRFTTQEGKFSIEYPNTWRMEMTTQDSCFCFWAQETDYTLSPLIGVASKPDGQRWSAEVLQDYQNILPTLLGTRLGQPTITWEGEPQPFLIPAGEMGSEQYGTGTSSAGTTKIRMIAVVKNGREYMILTAAQPEFWDGKQYIMNVMLESFTFLP